MTAQIELERSTRDGLSPGLEDSWPSASALPAPPAPGEARDHASAGSARIAALLQALQASLSPRAWRRVEALVDEIAGLHGATLARLVEVARALARDEAALEAQLLADPLLAGQISIHGLHPVSASARLDAALNLLRDHPAFLGATVEAELRLGGRVVLMELAGLGDRNRQEHHHLASLIRCVLQEWVPEVLRVDISGLSHSSGARQRQRSPEAGLDPCQERARQTADFITQLPTQRIAHLTPASMPEGGGGVEPVH